VVDSRRPLPYVVWPGFLARGLFVLVPFISTPWPFVGVLVAGTLLGTVSGPAQTALVERVYPREERGRALGTVRVVGAVVAIGLALLAGHLLGRGFLAKRLCGCRHAADERDRYRHRY
jgi:MFS family permease